MRFFLQGLCECFPTLLEKIEWKGAFRICELAQAYQVHPHIFACMRRLTNEDTAWTGTANDASPTITSERLQNTFDSASFRLIKSSRASPINSIGSAGWATTSEVSASDRGSPTVRFKNSASIAAPAGPTVAAIAAVSQKRFLVAGVREERDREIEGRSTESSRIISETVEEFASRTCGSENGSEYKPCVRTTLGAVQPSTGAPIVV